MANLGRDDRPPGVSRHAHAFNELVHGRKCVSAINARIQLQDTKYCGGSGSLGEICPS
jgi:hypothetical protein